MRSPESIPELRDRERLRRPVVDHETRAMVNELLDAAKRAYPDYEFGNVRYFSPKPVPRPVPWLALCFVGLMGFIFLVGLREISKW